MPAGKITARLVRMNRLVELLKEARSMLIIMQNSPDPDALAAAGGLRFLANSIGGIACTLAYSGRIGRAENKAMAKYLGYNLRMFRDVDPKRFDRIAMVDTQPGTGNNALPIDIVPDIVIDHHPIHKITRSSPYTDIRRRYGATATILFEYMEQLGLIPDMPLATAMLYGIRSDTQDLGREATQADTDAFLKLYPMANTRMLARIQNAPLSTDYYTILGRALQNAEQAGNAVFSMLGSVSNPDSIAEVADLLVRHEEADWALCCGVWEGRFILSLRAAPETIRMDCGKLMHRIVGKLGTGGGHQAMAGGQIPIAEDVPNTYVTLAEKIAARYYRATKVTAPPEPLIPVRERK